MTKEICIDVTSKTTEECRKIFIEHIERLGFTKFVKKTKGNKIYYVFNHE